MPMPNAVAPLDYAAPLEQDEYLDDLWFLLHHSEDDDCLMLGLTAQLDDSEAGDSFSPITIGGPLFSRIQNKDFSRKWRRMLHQYRVPEPLHMQDFVRPSGKCIGIPVEMKISLFRDIASLINSHKYYSLSISVPQADFRAILSEEICKNLIGPYALAFLCAVLLNRGVEQVRHEQSTISYLVDDGCAHPEQLQSAYSLVKSMEKKTGGFRYTGAFGFDTDDRVPALQAADVIAWSARRREVFGRLEGEFEQLNEILREDWPLHQHVSLPIEAIQIVATPINNWIAHNGAIPTFSEIIKR